MQITITTETGQSIELDSDDLDPNELITNAIIAYETVKFEDNNEVPGIYGAVTPSATAATTLGLAHAATQIFAVFKEDQ